MYTWHQNTETVVDWLDICQIYKSICSLGVELIASVDIQSYSIDVCTIKGCKNSRYGIIIAETV